jgi:hypothetical protein
MRVTALLFLLSIAILHPASAANVSCGDRPGDACDNALEEAKARFLKCVGGSNAEFCFATYLMDRRPELHLCADWKSVCVPMCFTHQGLVACEGICAP